MCGAFEDRPQRCHRSEESTTLRRVERLQLRDVRGREPVWWNQRSWGGGGGGENENVSSLRPQEPLHEGGEEVVIVSPVWS